MCWCKTRCKPLCRKVSGTVCYNPNTTIVSMEFCTESSLDIYARLILFYPCFILLFSCVEMQSRMTKSVKPKKQSTTAKMKQPVGISIVSIACHLQRRRGGGGLINHSSCMLPSSSSISVCNQLNVNTKPHSLYKMCISLFGCISSKKSQL